MKAWEVDVALRKVIGDYLKRRTVRLELSGESKVKVTNKQTVTKGC